MKLSDQAKGALMMALQKCLLEQIDIVPILGEMTFLQDEEGDLVVENPPNFQIEESDA
tara:strand:+ start:17211 stop:17384 length:174 start_codon:yes stop_codon:yes gene_type:complete